VNARVERLDPAAEELGNVGELVHGCHRESQLGDVGGAAAAGDELHAELRQPDGEVIEAGLVEDRDQSPLHQRTCTKGLGA
jgi:hypothetical protein